jgi:hypothetical protein
MIRKAYAPFFLLLVGAFAGTVRAQEPDFYNPILDYFCYATPAMGDPCYVDGAGTTFSISDEILGLCADYGSPYAVSGIGFANCQYTWQANAFGTDGEYEVFFPEYDIVSTVGYVESTMSATVSGTVYLLLSEYMWQDCYGNVGGEASGALTGPCRRGELGTRKLGVTRDGRDCPFALRTPSSEQRSLVDLLGESSSLINPSAGFTLERVQEKNAGRLNRLSTRF